MKHVLLLLLLVNTSTAFSQHTREQAVRISYSNLFLLNSDIGDLTFGDQGHPDNRQYILNANLIPHFIVTTRTSPVFMMLTPSVKVRIFANQDSKPVRTPSFIPGGTVFFNIDPAQNIERPRYMSIGMFHHSNGQDGPALNEDGSINVKNGNFATNFLRADYHFGRHSDWVNYHYAIGLEAHSGLMKVGDEAAYRNKFGKLRLNYQFSRATYIRTFTRLLTDTPSLTPQERNSVDQEFFRFVVDGMFVLEHIDAPLNQRLNLELKVYIKPRWSENTALFASIGYMGHDNYNIYFNQPYPFIRVGLAASNAFKFRNSENRVILPAALSP